MLIDIAQYVLIVVLTFFLSSYIIRYNSKIRAKGIKGAMRSQTAVFNKTRVFNEPSHIKKELVSQSQNHVQKYMLQVMVIENNAYWIKDNIFYVADIVEGSVRPDTARQIDTSSMSKIEIDKMMFILDKLNGVKE